MLVQTVLFMVEVNEYILPRVNHDLNTSFGKEWKGRLLCKLAGGSSILNYMLLSTTLRRPQDSRDSRTKGA